MNSACCWKGWAVNPPVASEQLVFVVAPQVRVPVKFELLAKKPQLAPPVENVTAVPICLLVQAGTACSVYTPPDTVNQPTVLVPNEYAPTIFTSYEYCPPNMKSGEPRLPVPLPL